jgi:alpha-glucosidase
MYDVLRFWAKRGIDGFRVDVLWLLIKDDELRDNPPNPDWQGTDPLAPGSLLPVYNADLPETKVIVEEMRAVLGEFEARVMIGEIYLPIERLVTYYGQDASHLGTHLPFNFQLLLLPWKADAIASAIAEYEKALPAHGWPNWVLGNHDQTRIASRVGPEQARVAAMLLLTLRGTPTMYYGDEIGMADAEIQPELQQDPARFHGPGRDPERTPMRWDSSPNAGFSGGRPWLPMGDALDAINVAAQRDDPNSMLSLVRRLIATRRAQPALTLGSWSLVSAAGDVLAYERSVPDKRLLILLNLGAEDASTAAANFVRGRVLVSTHADRDGEAVSNALHLRPNEGLLVEYLESRPVRLPSD